MQDQLESRTGLPDALRVLLRDYPREAWERHENFGALIRFWLDRHLMFRRLMESMTAEVERGLNGDQDARMMGLRLSRYGSLFVGELHGHHNIEDMHYFPQLKVLEAKLERGFDMLDRDHKDIDGHLDRFAEEANTLLHEIGTDGDWRPAAERMRHGLKRMDRFLDRHLTDEEELIVPVLLKHAPDGLT